ncbi:putative cation-transporting ATPase 13A4-like [Pontoporia blainvillei]|uniref:Cation-transporting ATPase 13A4-like n=1 Tax=Pontoporia blainvillei TaxID=48723 RepID=A0ABX0S033_PONBL|nr:putative cation-transporting ATPase 13A4-like [Pontoporia blainvillei]
MHKSAENKIRLEQLGRAVPENWVLNPFYIFQLFSVCLWFSEDYKEYAFAIVIMSIISITLTVYDLREQSVKLHHLVESHNSITVSVCEKKAGVQELESRFLVPGDLLILTGNKVQMPCDAILIDGSCVVDEGMLTGESIPVTKTPLPKMDSSVPWKTQSEADYKRHVLFCGTEVIQARGACSGTVKAVVLQTAYQCHCGAAASSESTELLFLFRQNSLFFFLNTNNGKILALALVSSSCQSIFI